MANGISESFEKATERMDFFGHPRGLATLFFTELWERFSYYGMRALLILFMTAETVSQNPGLGFNVGKAAAIYGLYTFFVYVLSLPGGWVADKLWGQKKAVFVGGVIIAAGHFSMAIPFTSTFFLGLMLIVIGTGLLKPNVSSMVGDLYPEPTAEEKERGERADWGARRDAGFSLFYMGINFGAILGPMLCGLLGEGYNWHYGFSLAGFGMILGLISYKIGWKYLGDAGDLKTGEPEEVINKRSKKFYGIVSATAAAIVLFGFLVSSGVIGITLKGIAGLLGVSVILIVILFFAVLIMNKKWTIPIVAITVVGFIFMYSLEDTANFVPEAEEELTSELTQMIQNERISTTRIQEVTDQNVGDIGQMEDEAVSELVSSFSVGQVLELSGLTETDLEELATEKLYIYAFQIAVFTAFIFFVIVCLARLFWPSVEVSLENKRLMVIFWLFILAALFWSGFEQAGSSLNLFAKDLTDRSFGPSSWLAQSGSIILTLLIAFPLGYTVYRVFQREDLWSLAKWVIGFSSIGILVFFYWIFTQIGVGWIIPASTLQLINPTFIVILAPIFGWLWTWLAHRNANPSIPVKFGLGLIGLAAGFFVLSWGAANASPDAPVSVSWLVVTYFLHTCGELALSPVGLSSMTKLAPKDRVSQMMGIWFVAAALGNLFAGLIAGQLETLAPASLFWSVALIVGGGGVVAILVSPGVKKLMGNIE